MSCICTQCNTKRGDRKTFRLMFECNEIHNFDAHRKYIRGFDAAGF